MRELPDVRYSTSKRAIKSILIGDERKYSITKMCAEDVSIEGFKIGSACSAGFGAAVDAFMAGKDRDDLFDDGTGSPSLALGQMFYFIHENLTAEHYADLVRKVLGSLMFNGKEIDDWSEHFDEYEEDFLEVLVWAMKENFTGFFIKSTIWKSSGVMVQGVVSQLKSKVVEVLKEQGQDTNEG